LITPPVTIASFVKSSPVGAGPAPAALAAAFASSARKNTRGTFGRPSATASLRAAISPL
jgi:hypothetical protein